MTNQPRISSNVSRDDHHPLRVQKYWPGYASGVSRICRTWETYPRPDQFNDLQALVQGLYNDAIEMVPPGQRPEGMGVLIQRTEQAYPADGRRR